MTVVNTLTLNVEGKAHNYAKIYAALLTDEFQRKRAYASIVALYALVNALEKTDLNIQKSMTLFRNPRLNEQYEISDLYVNNHHIDVRVIVDGTAVLLPKTHFENNILPDFYAVVKVDKTLQSAALMGFLKTDGIKTEPFDYHYFSASLDNLISYDEFLLAVNSPKVVSFRKEEHELFQNSYLALMDDELDIDTKNKLIRHMFACPECRTEFCCFTGFEMVSCNSSKYPELLNDKTLDIVGGTAVDDKKYEGKEETVYIGDDDNNQPKEEETVDSEIKEEPEIEEEKEETVSDILDELFNIDEMTEETPQEDKPVDVTPVKEADTPVLVEIKQDDTVKEDNTTEQPYPMPMFKEEDENILLDNNSKDESDELKETDDTDNKIYEDNTDDSIEYLEDNDVDMQIIPSEDNDSVVNQMKPVEEPDLVLYHNTDNKSENEAAIAPNAQTQSDVQKVIVDYDEYGEPIYSYITNIPNGENQDGTSEIKPLDDEDVLNEEFEVYAPEEDTTVSHIKNGGARPVEYVKSDDILESDETDSAPIIKEYSDDDSVKNPSNISELEDISTLGDDSDNWEEEAQKAAEETDEAAEEAVEDIEKTEENPDDILLEESEEDNDDSSGNSAVADTSGEDTSIENDEDEQPQEYEEDEDSENADDDEDVEYIDDDESEEYEDDESEEDENTSSKGKKTLLIAMIVVALLLVSGGFGIFAFLKNNSHNNIADNNNYQENNADNNFFEDGQNQQNDQNNMFEEPQEVQGEIVPSNENQETLPPPPNATAQQQEEVNHVPPLTENDLIPRQNNEPTSDVNKAITNAFSTGGNLVTVRNVNWLCTPQLFTDSAFKKYLQNIDNVLKLNLRKNVLDATEKPQNDTVSVKIAVDNSGNLLKYLISDSSGSGQVDEIVLRSIKETFEGEKAQILNDSNLKADKYYLKVVIKI